MGRSSGLVMNGVHLRTGTAIKIDCCNPWKLLGMSDKALNDVMV